MSLKNPIFPWLKTDMIGQQVIVRSNEDDPLLVGMLDRFEGPTVTGGVPVVKDANNKEWWCSGIVFPFSQKFYAFLNTLTPQEQWELLS